MRSGSSSDDTTTGGGGDFGATSFQINWIPDATYSGVYLADQNGHWTYVADSAHNEFVAGQVYTDSFVVLSADGTQTSVTVNMTGTNDGAQLSSRRHPA